LKLKLLATFITGIFLGFSIGLITGQETTPATTIITAKYSLRDLPDFIESLPDSHAKRNLQIVLATEYADDSEQLFHILRAYAEMKVKELNNKPTY